MSIPLLSRSSPAANFNAFNETNGLDQILEYHELPVDVFEGRVAMDLGCGQSDLGSDLALRGIHAVVLGIDMNRNTLKANRQSESNTIPIQGNLASLPVVDESVGVIIATKSLPMWAKDASDIDNFFSETKRVLELGGFLSIFPIENDIWSGSVFKRAAKKRAVEDGIRGIVESTDWTTLTLTPFTLTAIKKKNYPLKSYIPGTD